MDHQNLINNSMVFYQHQQLQNTNFFNNCDYSRQYYNQQQSFFQQDSTESSSPLQNPVSSTYASQFADFASSIDVKPEIQPKKKKKRSDKVSTTKWPDPDATIIREQVALESEVVREQVLIPETTDHSKLVLQTLGPKCPNPLLCRKLKRKCGLFVKPLREHILRTFKIDLNEGERRMFILNNVEVVPTKKKTVFKFAYFLKDHRFNRRVQVCKTMFLNTLSISHKEVKLTLKNSQCGMIPSIRYFPPKVKKKPNPNLYFSNAEYGDHAMSDYSDHFEDFKEEPDMVSDLEDYDPLNRNAVPKSLPGASKKKNIEDMIKSGEVSRIAVPEHMGSRCQSKRCKTCDNFNDERRSLLFSSFWNTMNWRERKSFILKTVICRKPNKTIYTNGKSPRQFTYDYHLPLTYNLKDFSDHPDVQLIPVCSIMYINTLGIKINVVKRVLKQGPDTFEEIQVEKIIQDPKYLLEAQMKTKHKRRINWKAVQRALKAKGETYFTEVKENNESKYLQRQPKKLKPRCSGLGCKRMSTRRCSEITDAQREEIFRHYWKDLDKEQKKIFICENVFEDSTARMKDIASVCMKKGKTIDLKSSRRESTFRYHLPVNGVKMTVCQTMFVGTLCVAQKSVRVVVKGSFGLIKNLNYNDCFFVNENRKAKAEQQKSSDESGSSSNEEEDSESEEDSEADANFCDDKSSSEGDFEEEEVLPKKERKTIEEPRGGWYKKNNKFLRDRCSEGCRRQCSQITNSQRQSIFNHFYNDLDSKGKDEFVRNMVTVDKTARTKMIESAFEKSGNTLEEGDVHRKFSLKYFLPKGLKNNKVSVCAVMFEATLSVSNSKIKRVVMA
ncbi:hypothetical protein ACFFRR_001643 [Megaselia abdita]